MLIELVGKAKECIKPDKNYVVVMSFPEKTNFVGFNIVLAPEISSSNYLKIIKSKNFKNICSYNEEIKNLKFSEHSGQIHMNICDNCIIKRELEKEKVKCSSCKIINSNG